MYGILFRAKAKPGKYQELVRFLKWDGEVCSDKEPGTLRFEFYPDPGDNDALYVYEAYRDENAFREHKRNDPYSHWKCVIRPELEEFCVLFKCDAVWSPEAKEKMTMNTPVTESEVEQFVREWFGKLDKHPPVEEMLPFLADEKLVMKMPEEAYCRHEGFKAWYKGVEKFFDQSHTIRGLQIMVVQDTAKVEIVVQWLRSEKNATATERGIKGFYAAQTWEVERSTETQKLVIVRYNVGYFVPMVTDGANLS